MCVLFLFCFNFEGCLVMIRGGLGLMVLKNKNGILNLNIGYCLIFLHF